ncbi:MAG: Crp/Fnr family transcriptional regulator [Nitrospirae bacterium]|nr:Crp/Fnr family transcriptional regulator [Nitrospirota bacterium]
MKNLLQKIPLFADLEAAEIDLLYRLVKTRAYSKGAIILQEDDPGEAMFMIVSGRAKVVHLSEDGREIILDMLGQGDFFGEMALLDQEPRSAHVTAVEPTELLVLERSAFLNQVEREPKIAIKMLIELSRRLRRADEKIQDLVLLDVYGRVARMLLRLARLHGKPLEDGFIITRLPTHHELADMVGASRETVSRVLADLTRRGVVRNSGRMLIIEKGEEMLRRAHRGDGSGRMKPGQRPAR